MILSNFAESLAELISEKNLTPAQFADEIGCGRGTISRYLHAQKMPKVSLLVRIADYFQYSTDYLLGREIEKYPRIFQTCPSFKERLPVLCKQLNVTKYRLQKETGIAESAIYNWQNGSESPNLENILKIADKFGCSVDFVIGRSNL